MFDLVKKTAELVFFYWLGKLWGTAVVLALFYLLVKFAFAVVQSSGM